jgi:mannose-6-phosphate isomerase-like protein (cupin superfamily)
MSAPAPGPYVLSGTCLRLRPDASVEPIRIGDDFWQRMMSGKLGDFHHEYLVTTFAYDKDWPNWEMHPNGDEIVMLLEGSTTMVLEIGGGERLVELNESCAYVVVPRGTWHTSRARGACRMLFITAGEGTQHRPAKA